MSQNMLCSKRKNLSLKKAVKKIKLEEVQEI